MPATATSKLWIAIGDIHEKTGNLAKIPELAEASGIIVTGDLTNCGNAGRARQIMEALGRTGLPALAQIGNMDLAEVNEWLEQSGGNLHRHSRELAPGLVIFGIGGSNVTPMRTPSEFSEESYSAWLEDLWQKASAYPHQVLVSHSPPKDTVCDDIGGGIHVGSTAVREFIEEHQPEVCLCGHIHEGRGTDRIGRTVVINPGMLADGGYVALRYADGQLRAELRQVEQ